MRDEDGCELGSSFGSAGSVAVSLVSIDVGGGALCRGGTGRAGVDCVAAFCEEAEVDGREEGCGRDSERVRDEDGCDDGEGVW